MLSRKSQGSILIKQDKPKAIQVFEEVCSSMNEKVPNIFKKVKNGQFTLKEVLLTPGQTYALQKAAAHFENFADKVEFVDNNFSDSDMSEMIVSLASVPQIKHLAIQKNEFGDQTMEALSQLF